MNPNQMNNLPELLRVFLAGFGTAGVYLFGGWDAILSTLVMLVIIDYITGVMAAYFEHKLNSEIGFKGIAKKVCMFLLVAMATMLDSSSGLETPLVRTAVIMFFIANEGISILENAGRLGLPIPEALKTALPKLNSDEPKRGGG